MDVLLAIVTVVQLLWEWSEYNSEAAAFTVMSLVVVKLQALKF